MSAKKRTNARELGFQVINITLLSLFAIICLVPMLNILAKSFSSEAAISTGNVWIWPKGFNTKAYEFVLTSNFVRPFFIQLISTASGTIISVTLLFTFAFPLSRENLRFKKPILMLVVFTMIFNPGIIPNYLLISELGLINTLWAIILPGAFSGFNLMIVRSYIRNIPESVVESALVEGARYAYILIKIILPLSLPVLATMVLFISVGYWNSYFDAMIYLTDPKLKTLQVFLREIVMNLQNISNNYVYDPDSIIARSPQTVRSASIVATTIPVMMIYPFLQKYYIQGLSIGSVKG